MENETKIINEIRKLIIDYVEPPLQSIDYGVINMWINQDGLVFTAKGNNSSELKYHTVPRAISLHVQNLLTHYGFVLVYVSKENQTVGIENLGNFDDMVTLKDSYEPHSEIPNLFIGLD